MSSARGEATSGRLIVFEGLDGAGTTTQSDRLAQALRSSGIPVEVTNEPSNGPIGAMLRLAIEGRVRMDPATMALAFAADRTDHLFNEHNGIVNFLREGRWVVCDRYVLSSLAYQVNTAIDREWLLEINRNVLEPDLTVFVDTAPDRCVSRIAARSSTTELFHSGDRLLATLRNYQDVISSGAVLGRLSVIDGNRSVDEVADEVWDVVADTFNVRRQDRLVAGARAV